MTTTSRIRRPLPPMGRPPPRCRRLAGVGLPHCCSHGDLASAYPHTPVIGGGGNDNGWRRGLPNRPGSFGPGHLGQAVEELAVTDEVEGACSASMAMSSAPRAQAMYCSASSRGCPSSPGASGWLSPGGMAVGELVSTISSSVVSSKTRWCPSWWCPVCCMGLSWGGQYSRDACRRGRNVCPDLAKIGRRGSLGDPFLSTEPPS